MKFKDTPIPGAYVIEPERIGDARGFFARTYCQKEFSERGLSPDFVQCNISFNRGKGTLRGMHYQAEPHSEIKIVRCTMGSIYDVIVDLRPESAAFKSWFAVELTAENRIMLYVPAGIAHGFQTLEDNTEVFYQMSGFYAPDYARGVRWDDPAFGIEWPEENRTISDKDLQFESFGQ